VEKYRNIGKQSSERETRPLLSKGEEKPKNPKKKSVKKVGTCGPNISKKGNIDARAGFLLRKLRR